jgi:hypothetical protein
VLKDPKSQPFQKYLKKLNYQKNPPIHLKQTGQPYQQYLLILKNLMFQKMLTHLMTL